MRIRLRVADATHKLEVRQTLEELLVMVGELVRCQPSDVRVGLNKQEALSGPPSATLASLGICRGDLLHLLSPQRVVSPQPQRRVVPAQPQRQDDQMPPAVQAPQLQASAQQSNIPQQTLQTVLAANSSSDMPDLLLLLLVHAVMLDTGFVGASEDAADKAVVPVTQRITASTCKLAYRLKLSSESPAGELPLCSLKCSAIGRHLVIAGSVAGMTARHVTLSAQREHPGAGAAQHDSWSNSWEAARPLWVKVKDELARPLLADAAQQGLCAPPPSLLALDAEALDNILQQLPARDLAAVSATCRQLRGTASADQLWRRLVEQDFPARAGPERRCGWKGLYGAAHRDREEARERRLAQRRHPQLRPVPGFRGGNPFMPAPGPGGIVGGDYDRLPFGGVGPFGGRQPPGHPGSLFGIRHGSSHRSHVNMS